MSDNSAKKKNYSLVICNFNRLEHLKTTVTAVRSLKRDVEVILTDDGSTDGSLEWAKKSGFFDKIFTLGKPGNFRLCTIRNMGIAISSREHVIIIDADCMPQKNFFIGHDEITFRHPGALSIGMAHRYSSDGKTLISKDQRFKHFGKNKMVKMSWERAYGGNICMTKSLWTKIGGFDENFNGEWGFEDLDFAKRAANIGIPVFAHKFSTVRHLHHKILKSAGSKNNKNIDLFYKKHGIRF